MEDLKRILVVDDDIELLNSIKRILFNKRGIWDLDFVDSVSLAKEKLSTKKYDVVLTDIQMPEQDGFSLISFMRNEAIDTSIPIVVFSGLGDTRLKQRVLNLGVTDFLNKPINSSELIARLQNVITLKEYQDRLKYQNILLEHEVTLQTINLEFTQREMIMRLAIMAEYHDHETGNHVLRMASLSKALATACGFDKNFIETIYLTSPMHDVGKIGVPAAILQKPGKLTQKEWTVVKQHCKFGKEILSNNFPHLDSFWKELPDLSLLNQVTEVPNRFLETASKIAYTHHEHWDGKGYPLGLEREQIPIEGRITALTDAYDVMRSKRPYKEAYPEEEVIRIIKAEAGYHFDPYLVKVLIGIRKQVNSIFNQYLENVE